MVPVRRLVDSVILSKRGRLPSSAGIAPVSMFSCRVSSRSLLRLPSSAGIVPVSWLLFKYSSVSPLSWPSWAGRVPSRLDLASSRSPTRLSRIVMPCQLPMAVVTDQAGLRVALPVSWS